MPYGLGTVPNHSPPICPQVPGQVHGPEMLARGMVALEPMPESVTFDLHQDALQTRIKHSSRKSLVQSRGKVEATRVAEGLSRRKPVGYFCLFLFFVLV